MWDILVTANLPPKSKKVFEVKDLIKKIEQYREHPTYT